MKALLTRNFLGIFDVVSVGFYKCKFCQSENNEKSNAFIREKMGKDCTK
jgi:hypothetical protein